ncbi:MAG TPA: carboxypeptidase regulatory-like domain-containing protein [Bryobacteraceae bacterium]|nr:carboxypeptidase regulatory-like domain-containing protein [Bryobacteraceae bacterium]
MPLRFPVRSDSKVQEKALSSRCRVCSVSQCHHRYPASHLFGKIALSILLTSHRASLPAMQTTATIQGTVQDATSAVVPGVQVKLVNKETGDAESVVTGPLGRFVFPSVRVGTYTLSAERVPFTKYLLNDIPVRVDDHLTFAISLDVQATRSEVNVSAPVTSVALADATLGYVVENKSLVDLPLNGRNYLELTYLVPGSTPPIGYSEPATPKTQGGLTSSPQVNGSRAEANGYLLDGADNNEAFLGSAAAVPPIESLQEFRVATHLFSAQFGGAGGAVVNVVTRSGTNAFHGSVYEFLRNDAFDARDFFSPTVSTLKRNQFGVALGGPIRKNKTFFFGNYEGIRERSAPTRTASVPTLAEREGDFSRSAVKPVDPTTGMPFVGDRIPANRINSISSRLLQFYPAPNTGVDRSTASPTEPSTTDSVLARLDHKVTMKNDLTLRFLLQDGDRRFHFVPTFLGPLDVPNFPVSDRFHFQNWNLTNTYGFSERTLTQVRFSYNRANLDAAIPQFQIDAKSLGFTFPVTVPFHNIPLVAVSGLTAIGTSNFDDASHINNVFVFENVWNFTRGRHLITAGGRIGAVQVNTVATPVFMGSYFFTGAASGNAFGDFLLGDPGFFLQIGGDPGRAFRSKHFAYFIEDSFAVTPHLRMTLGLRHDIFLPLYDRLRRTGSFRPGEQSIVRPSVPRDVVFPGDPGVSRSTYQLDWRNFGPQVGIAWDPFGDGNTSVRAGYGIYYKPAVVFVAFQTSVSPSITGSTTVFSPNFADPFLSASPFAPGQSVLPVGPGTQVNTIDPNLTTPYTQHYSLSIQRQLTKDFVLELGYVGGRGVHLLGTVQLNPATFVPGDSTQANINARRPYQPYGAVYDQMGGFSSSYNALQASLTRHWSRGLALLVSYTYSRAIDDVSVPQVFQTIEGQPPFVIAANPYDWRAERAASSFDMPHTFALSFVWELPRPGWSGWTRQLLGGWQLNGIFQAHSGPPFTVYDPSDPNVDGESSDRPNLVGNPFPSGFKRSVARDFNTAAFAPTPQGANVFGNLGRNSLRSRGLESLALSVFRTFNLNSEFTLQIRAEAFNVLNHANFAPPVSDITSPNFGRILNTRPSNPRQLQFALRLAF